MACLPAAGGRATVMVVSLLGKESSHEDMSQYSTKRAAHGQETKKLRQSGQAGLFVVLSLTVSFAMMGLAVDLGYAYFRRNVAQAAADSAALAAAIYASNSGYK